jgi:hypothetical protein
MKSEIVIDFSKWPEMVHALRRSVVQALLEEAADAEPKVAEALRRVAACVDAGLKSAADIEGGQA